MTKSKNVTALLVTLFIGLGITWLILGHSTNHIYGSWIFGVLNFIAILVLLYLILGRFQNDDFDLTMLLECIALAVYAAFNSIEVSVIHEHYKTHWWTVGLNILNYFIIGMLGLFLLFLLIRYIQEKSHQDVSSN